ncbi:NAD-dependent epimerase/dehydratase family protein [Citrobacter werkmanii]|uniref:NAD-dependent epimerase/dehydratase family protein n=1 Tax=Citrobacter werkmanii TaxID=67827 RepID=UPI002651DCE3|nr:NAD-dependent epimerase/dehydratase family protein [Citrobacter werkmanii]MDN8555947.1 NAD-dependent epimerase/dehydratase family protein [Citrobacter werkmanii]
MANFLIMGAGGFIGQHLTTELLSRGEQVTAVGHGVHVLKESEKLTVVSGELDLALLDFIEKPDFIYFLLGGSSVTSSMNSPIADFNKTFLPLTALIEKLKYDWLDSHLIFISSAAVYGDNASQSTSINTKAKPLSVYGLHKLLAEQYIEFHQRNFNIKAKIIRPFSIYGPGLKKQLIWDAMCKIQNQQHQYFGSGLEERDWVHISDLITLLIGMADNFSDFADVINAGYGDGVRIKDIISILYQLKNVNGVPQFINKSKVGDPKHLACDASEQKFMTKYHKKPLKEGLVEVVNWFDSIDVKTNHKNIN